MSSGETYITAKEAAARTPSSRAGRRTHISTIIRWIMAGKLPGFRRGRYWFVRPEDLDAMFVRKAVPPATPKELSMRPGPQSLGREDPEGNEDHLRKERPA